MQDPHTKTTYPIVTGGSVIGLKYKDGVMLVSDTLASYGSMARYKDFSRMAKIAHHTAIVSSGEMSDFQEIVRVMQEYNISDQIQGDMIEFMTPMDYANILCRWSYHMRLKMDPLYTFNIIGGIHADRSFLGMVDCFGTLIEDDFLVTGLAHYFCKVLITEKWREDMTEEEAKKVLEDCMRVLFVRDSRASDRIQFCKITQGGVEIEKPYVVDTKWEFTLFKELVSEKVNDMIL